jgi:hypothetical protein
MLPSLCPASSKPVVSGTRANLDPVVNAEAADPRVEDRARVAGADVADAHAAVGARGEELKVGLVQGCPP